jgi:NDP-sugar pyrophosphorylase family protein
MENNMTKPTLVVMAAGMGSRYGGLKQIDPVTEQGEIIIDFSLYDAMLAGFEEVVFIIKKEIEADVRERIDAGAGRHLKIIYEFQELEDLPPGYLVPEGRIKPWGTCHAVLAAKDVIKGNFAVINSDDFYGAHAFNSMYEELLIAKDKEKYDFSMVGYKLTNTLTEYGYVSRGVCAIDEDGSLRGVDERLKIMKREGKVQYEDEEGWHEVSEDSTVSMNFWGFTPSILKEMEEDFPVFLDVALKEDPMKCEYLLPRMIDGILKEEKATVKVLPTDERWFGITYKEDMEHVTAAVKAMKDAGKYPEKLW